MGHRGKVREQAEARRLRAGGATLREIAAELGVSVSSASLWVRDVPVPPRPGRRAPRSRPPNALQRRKQAEIDELRAAGREEIGTLSERDLLIAGTALYAGEGAKADGTVRFTNSDPAMIDLFMVWFRRFFLVDESRLRLWLYLHEGLDLDRAKRFWADRTGIPVEQFGKPYRAVPDPSIRRSKHPLGCASVSYSCSRTHRAVMGLVHALLSSEAAHGPG